MKKKKKKKVTQMRNLTLKRSNLRLQVEQRWHNPKENLNRHPQATRMLLLIFISNLVKIIYNEDLYIEF